MHFNPPFYSGMDKEVSRKEVSDKEVSDKEVSHKEVSLIKKALMKRKLQSSKTKEKEKDPFEILNIDNFRQWLVGASNKIEFKEDKISKSWNILKSDLGDTIKKVKIILIKTKIF